MSFSIGKKIAAAAVVGFVGLGAGAAAWASEGSGSSTAASTTPAAVTAPAGSKVDGKRGGLALRILRRADHGTIELKVKGVNGAAPTWQTFTFDKGSVTAVSPSQITLARPDGQSVTLQIGATTKFRGVTSAQDLQTGKGALVISQNGTATQILQAKNHTTPATTVPPAAPQG